RVTDDLCVGSQPEPTEDLCACFFHQTLCLSNRRIDSRERSFDQDCVMHGSTDVDSSFCTEATCQSQHLRAVGLHWEIPYGARVWLGVDMHAPTKDRMNRAIQHRKIERTVGPPPKRRVCFMVHPQ